MIHIKIFKTKMKFEKNTKRKYLCLKKKKRHNLNRKCSSLKWKIKKEMLLMKKIIPQEKEINRSCDHNSQNNNG